MAVNENGRLVDDRGNVVVDHIWGNIPMQPNDVRIENGGELLDPDASFHEIAYAGWNGYPGYVPNTTGEGAGNIVVPNVVGLATADAIEVLVDAGYAAGDITTTAAAAILVTNVALTDDVATLTTDNAHGYSVGDEVVIAGLTDTTFNGTHTLITGTASNSLVFDLVNNDVTSASDNGTATVVAKEGTVGFQSPTAGENNVTFGDSVSITPYAEV